MGTPSTVISKKLQKVLGDITEDYPDLRITRTTESVEITGSLPIIVSGTVLDRFLIEIQVDPSYPRKIPRVYELGGRIPKSLHRHTSPKTGEACVCLIDQWSWVASKCPTVLEFINGPVKDFFLWQLCFIQYGKDRCGAWAHERNGRLEFYQAILDTDDPGTIRKFLLHLSEPKYKANWLCYCGSGRKACKCHKSSIISFRSKISPQVARSALQDIKELIRASK